MKNQETNKTNYIQTTKHFKDYEEIEKALEARLDKLGIKPSNIPSNIDYSDSPYLPP